MKSRKDMAIRPIKIFYCYAHEDDALREQLASHLSPLRRLRDITGWFNRDIRAGAEWERESMQQFDTANIILLLLSADFMASDYCYTVEMSNALERHRAGTACVIPIPLRPVAWERTPIGGLSPLPTNGVPITLWENQDAAWLNVVQGVSAVVRNLLPKQLLSSQDASILYTEQGPLSGQIIGGKYLLGDLIGEGGFSQVYKAQHLQVQRQQAVKILLERYFRKLEFRDRFLREARTVASLDHPNIIHLDDLGIEASQAYLVMPYISGGTFQDILEKQQGFLEQDQIMFYLEHICAALDYAHKQGIVHLDLKPLNLLLHEDGRILLSDFGFAHLIKDGAVAGGSSLRVGTPHYMAPEHIKGFPERRSDLFSLGVILYQMLVGRLPFDGLPYETILIKNMTEWPPQPRALRPELSPAAEDMLARALAKQPEQRYQTAKEFLEAFRNALGTQRKLPLLAANSPATPQNSNVTGASQDDKLGLEAIPSGTILHHHYRIERVLGERASGRTYLSVDLQTNTRYAIKEYSTTQAEGQEQLKHEANVLSQLHHPNLPAFQSAFVEYSRYYMVINYIEGHNLTDLIRHGRQRETVVPLLSILDWILEICDAVCFMHSQRPPVIHRDIKPDNISITPNGAAILLDLGNAKAAADGRRTLLFIRHQGTPGYAPPEQYPGGSGTDIRSDVYALGGTLFFALTGHEPPSVSTRNQSMEQGEPDLPSLQEILERNPPEMAQDPNARRQFRLGINKPAKPAPRHSHHLAQLSALPPMQLNQLNQLIHHAMAMNPGSRYPTVAEFAADLKKVIAALPSSASIPPATQQPDLPQLDKTLQAAKEQQLAAAQSALRCPRCGWGLPLQAHFCSRCGFSLSVPN